MQAVDSRLQGMCAALSELGSDYCAKDLPAIGGEGFDLLKDESELAASASNNDSTAR